MTKTHIETRFNHTFEDAVRKAGGSVQCLWQLKGVKDTNIVGMEALAVYPPDKPASVVIVQTYGDGGGWDVFTASQSNRVDETIADALKRIGF